MEFINMIVLDTHIWLWWILQDNNNLSKERFQKIEQAEEIAVSAISCFEIAWLEQHKRITLPFSKQEWFKLALEGSGIILLPISPEIATVAVELPEHHSDPQDRIIIATAIVHQANLMSSDRKFSFYKELESKLI
jgi:PIN domain nuclease of toxin-antitoxin system